MFIGFSHYKKTGHHGQLNFCAWRWNAPGNRLCWLARLSDILTVIIDELGKFLEFAALHPQRQDVFLLQQLAESASRSGDQPLFIVGLLHQGFNAYADYLNQSAQREWDKVAGRFDEIVFNQPVEQIAHVRTRWG
jgi:hypothetical protein